MGPREVYFLGTCMGAWAAMYFGHCVGADEVWAFAPTPPDNEKVEEMLANGVKIPELPQLLGGESGSTQFRVYFCEESNDRVFAEQLRGCRGVTLTAVAGQTHRVLAVLKEEGKLKGLFPPWKGRE